MVETGVEKSESYVFKICSDFPSLGILGVWAGVFPFGV